METPEVHDFMIHYPIHPTMRREKDETYKQWDMKLRAQIKKELAKKIARLRNKDKDKNKEKERERYFSYE